MTRELKNIVRKLMTVVVDQDIDSSSHFFAVSVALIKLNNKCSDYSCLLEQPNYLILRNRFTELSDSFELIYNELSAKERDSIFEDIKLVVNSDTALSDDIISWGYQFMKKGLEKAAFSKLGQGSVKIEGKDLLYTTQFFTDKYMTEYLVNELCEKLNKDNIESTTFYDTACGGGNFINLLANKCYKLLSEFRPEWSNTDKVRFIISNMLVGYDLDNSLARIASISVFVSLSKYCNIDEIPTPLIFEGKEGDIMGYLAAKVKTNRINGLSLENCLDKPIHYQRMFITNPPFMGRRDMSLKLKKELNKNFPDCNSDLCASFMSRSLERMRKKDSLAVVVQSNWMHLKSFKEFRNRILSNYQLSDCVDLGTKAFKEINGEKTSVALCSFEFKNNSKTRFQNYKYLSYDQKVKALSNLNLDNVYYINQDNFLKNRDYEITHELNDSFRALDNLPLYGRFGTPMQGTSTGDNKKFVKYFWEVGNNEKWRSVSKGGGFSKWSGLNFYKVLWGDNAEEIRKNPGSAIRNLDKIETTDLVYSDTGTLGLNIRVLEKDQVFIASGPGIEVKYGNKYAHLAFLNSRLASFLLKMKNPKFTVSAGYISNLPVKKKLLHSETLSELSKQILNIKHDYLKSKLPNPEFESTNNYSICPTNEVIERSILSDFKNDFSRLKLADRIDKEILNSFNLNKKQLEKIASVVGTSPFERNSRQEPFSQITELDNHISKLLDVNCLFRSRSINGFRYGTDSIVEHLSYEFQMHPTDVISVISNNLSNLRRTKRIYLMDFYHKALLGALQIKRINEIPNIEISLEKLARKFSEIIIEKDTSSDPNTLLQKLITEHHFKSFMKRPFITLDSGNVIIGLNQ